MTTFSDLGTAKYVLLTTFRRDGRAVATPVWVLPAPNGEVAIWTGADSGKIKRIRHDGRVTIAPSTVRGQATGDPVEGRARIGDEADVRWAARRILRKYGLIGFSVFAGSILRHRRIGGTAVFVSPV
ncbi:PPOX class F420-dependent oxidoreductase [Actinoplanes sp. HUAS TT8]|uniref:PPOX class F420-dependent oxidoreductase n=1 Tax=Actinoplanes sp. HUAS TT8 TaxID=3447453 RepID=UPI003F5268BC